MEYTQFGINIFLNTPNEENFKKWIFRIDCIPHKSSNNSIEDIENLLQSIFNPYQNKSFNDLEFHVSLENIAKFFKNKIQTLLNDNNWALTFIEVCIPPRYTYSINLISNNYYYQRNNNANSVLHNAPYMDNHTAPVETNNPLRSIMRSTENSIQYSTQISAEVTKIINRMSK